MLIQCTKKLLDKLNIKPEIHKEEEALFSWHANLITVFRKKAVVLVNDKNRYVIVLHGLKAKDFKRLDEHIIEAIRKIFQDECIKDEIIEDFINHSKEIKYTKTKNRSMVARLNKACEHLYYYEELLGGNSIYKTDMSRKASQYFVGNGKNEYIYPNEEMYKDIEVFAGQSIFKSKAVELKVTLPLKNYNVWRRIIVPYNITFSKLHKVLQVAFGWKDYHIHEFYIFDKDNPIVNLVCSEEAFDYGNDIPMKLENGIELSEYIPMYKKIKYNYDFGDDWQHYIEVERVIDDYDKNYSVCIEGEGNTPPEDVGGKYGYEEFLEIIADENNPEYRDTVNWGRGQGYEDFDIEMVNRRLKIY